jgi:hypothetical protein
MGAHKEINDPLYEFYEARKKTKLRVLDSPHKPNTCNVIGEDGHIIMSDTFIGCARYVINKAKNE